MGGKAQGAAPPESVAVIKGEGAGGKSGHREMPENGLAFLGSRGSDSRTASILDSEAESVSTPRPNPSFSERAVFAHSRWTPQL